MTPAPATPAARSTPGRRPFLAPGPRAAAVALSILVACQGGGTTDSPAPPAAAIVASTTALQTVEGGERASFTVRLATSPPHDAGLVFVKVTTLDTTEGLVTTTMSGVGSPWVMLPFTRDDWSTPHAVYVVPQDDALADGQVVYSVELSIGAGTLDPAYLQVPKVTIAVTNGDDEVPGFRVSKATAATTESPGPGVADSFTVVLNVAPTGTVTIPVQSLDVSEGKLFTTAVSCAAAQASVDLVFTTSSWSTPQSVFVCGQQDLEDDGNVTYTVQVGAPTGAPEYAALQPKTVRVTNSDDDTAGITVAAGATPLVTSESGTTATFTVRLNTMPAADVIVPVTSGNPAEGLLSSGSQNGLDAVSLTFTPSSWSTIQTVTVTGQDDGSSPSANVTYDVVVGPPTGDPVYAASVAAQVVPVTNLDNDAPAFVLSPTPGSNLTVSETGVTTATFSVRVNRQPAADVVIPVSASDATEALVQGGSPPAQQAIALTFTALDWQTPQTVTVVAQADTTVDGDQLSTITVGESASADPDFDALPATSLRVTTVDTDAAGFVVPGTLVTHTEGGAATSFTVVLSKRPAVDVVVPVSSGDAAEGLLSTSPGGPFSASVTLTFTNADALTPQTVYVQGPLDYVDDGDRTYAITVGPTDSADERWRLAAKTVSARNVDVDTARLVVTPPGGLVTSEAGGTDTFTVKLASKPSANVTVPVAVDVFYVDEAQVSWDSLGPATSIAITFTPDDWATEKQVTVTGLDDAVVDGNVGWTVLVRSQSADPKYASLLEVVGGRNDDDDVGQSEGTALDPVNLDSALPHAGQVGLGAVGSPAYSYYSLSRPADALTLSLVAPTAGVTLTLYDNADFASGVLCETTLAGRTPGACSAPPGSPGRLYVRVSTTGSMGAAFTIREGPVQPTWFGSPFQPILDGQTADTIATVNGGPTWISKVTVNLTITYSWDADLDIRLQAPDGSQVVLSAGNGGSGDNYTNTTFDDAAATPITAGAPPFTGTYAPEQPLSALNGKSANGTWRLRVYGATLSGSIREWSVTIE